MNPTSALAEQSRARDSTALTLVVGLGNPILGDDGVGWRVAQEVRTRLAGPSSAQVNVECLSVGGLGLMEQMVGYERAIIVDAINTGEGSEGDLSSFPLAALPDHSLGHTTSAHDTSLQNALNVAQEMDFNVPQDVWVVGIEARRTDEFTEQLSSQVEAAVPHAVELVLGLLQIGAEE